MRFIRSFSSHCTHRGVYKILTGVNDLDWLFHTYYDDFVILFRLLFAFVVGAIMGLERERYYQFDHKIKTAGFRTYSLVCLGSCIFGLASIYGFPTIGSTHDPGRIAAQVVTGIGFIGAGTIMKSNEGIRGLTTAAGMWVASSIGLMISSGLYVPSIIAALLAYVILDFHRLFPTVFNFRSKDEKNLQDLDTDDHTK
jgi:putative Mg2+ transporter-C (MgtC) family protein